VKKGELPSRDRDRTFLDMTEEVARLVLADNAAQALALTLDGRRSAARYEDYVDFVHGLITNGVLDRVGNDVPSRKDLLEAETRSRGLPRPLLALVLGHVKIWAFTRILETGFPDGPEGLPFLVRYFPQRLQSLSGSFAEHPLKREIIATAAVNHVINHAGVEFLERMMKDTGASIGEVVKLYLDCERSAGAQEKRSEIQASRKSAESVQEQLLRLEDLLESSTKTSLAGGSEAAAAGAVFSKSTAP
jgi:glutamate dehydrogenase